MLTVSCDVYIFEAVTSRIQVRRVIDWANWSGTRIQLSLG